MFSPPMPCTVKKTFEAARETGNFLIAQVKANQPILHEKLEEICAADPPADIAAAGRARWKVENETFNVLKNNGYNLEHNFGHGKQTLASVLVALNLLAFAIHNACTLMEPTWRAAWQLLGARTRLFEHIRTITAYLVFPSWDSLFRSIRTGLPPPQTA